ncbi:MAG: FeoB-associated Cys-rich membrane protein [Clostridiales bacterium]|nr:FeoB-associated Cys-rich membrane protein [Clostridiales bacterium]
MSIVLLNMVVVTIIIGIAIFLNLVAVGLIIASVVRSVIMKKKGRKTLKIGMWTGIVMLAFPWIVIGTFYILGKIDDVRYNRVKIDSDDLAEAVIDDDWEELYDMMADDVVLRNGLTEDGLRDMMERYDICDLDEEDIDRFTEISSTDNHYRVYTTTVNGRRQMCFHYTMHHVNGEDGRIDIFGVSGDASGEEYVGIYSITYRADDTDEMFGEAPPQEVYNR